MSSHFTFFPTLLYANTAAVNVIAKVKFDDTVAKTYAAFYPYTLSEGERADQVAETYYDDARYDWVVYMSNGIIDPAHEWYKGDRELNNLLVGKYGSVANTLQQVKYYTTDYANDDRQLSTATYNALSSGEKKYWMPIIGESDQIIGYQRKDSDWVLETNKVVALTGTFGAFAENDLIKQSSTVTGTVGFANSTTLMIKHVSGTWEDSTPVYNMLTGALANATITSVATVSESIPAGEVDYWSSVSIFDYEVQLNESRKHIRLLDVRYLDKVESDMRELLA